MYTGNRPDPLSAPPEPGAADPPPSTGRATDAPRERRPRRLPRSFAPVAAALFLAVLLLAFVVQNSEQHHFEFLWTDFTMSAGVALLLAGVVGGTIVAALAAGRIFRLRHERRALRRTMA